MTNDPILNYIQDAQRALDNVRHAWFGIVRTGTLPEIDDSTTMVNQNNNTEEIEKIATIVSQLQHKMVVLEKQIVHPTD